MRRRPPCRRAARRAPRRKATETARSTPMRSVRWPRRSIRPRHSLTTATTARGTTAATGPSLTPATRKDSRKSHREDAQPQPCRRRPGDSHPQRRARIRRRTCVSPKRVILFVMPSVLSSYGGRNDQVRKDDAQGCDRGRRHPPGSRPASVNWVRHSVASPLRGSLSTGSGKLREQLFAKVVHRATFRFAG